MMVIGLCWTDEHLKKGRGDPPINDVVARKYAGICGAGEWVCQKK